MAAVQIIDLQSDPTLEAANAAETIGLGQSIAPGEVIRLIYEGGFLHVVQKDALAFDSEMAAARIMLHEPRKFLDHPLDVVLGLQNQVEPSRRLEIACDAAEKKNRVLSEFGDFVAGIKGSRRLWDQALLVADELYTNSSKNAWPEGAKLFMGEPTRAGRIEFFAAHDEQRLVVGCRDTFGELDVRHVIGRIHACFKNGVAESIRSGTGGAGIGSHMVFDACTSYYAGAEKHKMSVVCIVLPLGLSRRAASGLPKNVHLLP